MQEPKDIGLAKSCSIGTVIKVVAQTSYQQYLVYSQIYVPWCHIGLSLTKPIWENSYLILVDLYLKGLKVIPTKSVVIDSPSQVLATHDIP